MEQQRRIIIKGRLGKNPELKYTQKQEPVCHFTVAETIENQEKPHWHKVVVWGKQAEHCQMYLKKGSQIFVQGRIVQHEFKNSSGELKSSLELKADLVGFTQERG